MQVLMDVKELHRIRARWFKAGIFFTLTSLTLLGAITFYLTNHQDVSTVSKLSATNDFKPITSEIYTSTTPAPNTQGHAGSTQTGQAMFSKDGWGIIIGAGFFTFLTASMFVVIVAHFRSKARQKEIASKPEGFWDWNERE